MNYNEYLQNLKLMQTMPNYPNMANYTYTPQFRSSYPVYSPFEPEHISNYNNNTDIIKNTNSTENTSRNLPNTNMNEVLRTIRELVNNQRNDLMLYDYLISVAPNTQDKRLLEDIREKKEMNYRKLRELYSSLSGTILENIKPADTNMPYVNYMEGLRNAINFEFDMSKKLKFLLSNLQNMPEHLKILELVLDSMGVISKLNYLLNKNRQ